MESQRLRDSCNEVISQYNNYIRTHHPERMGYGVSDSSRCDVCNQVLDDEETCVCLACGCCAHKLCACVNLSCTKWMCIVCVDIARYSLNISLPASTPQSSIESALSQQVPSEPSSNHQSSLESSSNHQSSTEPSFNEQTLNEIKKIRSQIHCVLCGYSSGLLFRTVYNGVYAHPACACWIPEVTISNHVHMIHSLPQPFSIHNPLSPLQSLPYINPHTSSSIVFCRFCKRQGHCVTCPVPGCNQSYHVLCAFRNGLEAVWRSNTCMEEEGDFCLYGSRHRILCSYHSYDKNGVITPNLIAKGSWIDTQTAVWQDYAIVKWDQENDSFADMLQSFSLNRLLMEGHRSGRVEDEKQIQQGLSVLERLRVCELTDLWEVPVTLINDGGVCVSRNGVTLGLLTVLGRKNEKKNVKAQALNDGMVLYGRDMEHDRVIELTSDGNVKRKRGRPKKYTLPESNTNPPPSSQSTDTLEMPAKRKRGRPRKYSLVTTELASLSQSSSPLISQKCMSHSTVTNPSLVADVTESETTQRPLTPIASNLTPINRSQHLHQPTSEVEKSKVIRKSRKSSISIVQPKRVSILPAPKLPLAPQRTLEPIQINVTKSLLLSQFLQSKSFLQLLGPDPTSNDSFSLRGFLDHYFMGVTSESIKNCERGILLSDDQLIPASSDSGLSVEQILAKVRKSRKIEEKITLLRLLLRVSMMSVYPPHMCVSSLAQTKGTKERNILAEVHRLGGLCELLFTMSLEISNISQYLEDRDTYLEDHQMNVNRQCICLSRENFKERLLVCMQCGVGYHPSCLALELTDCPDLVLTKYFGYWSLDRGFLCPACCKGDIFEMSPTLRGYVQIRDTAVIAWQNKLRKKVYVSRR